MLGRYKIKESSGFTIVELLIAMTVFAILLVAVSAGLIQIGRSYYRSVITTRTQDTNRAIVTELSDALKFSGTGLEPEVVTDISSGEVTAICIGSTRYTVNIGQQVTDGSTDYGLYRDQMAGDVCEPLNPVTGGQELLGENMRLNELDVTAIDDSRYRITVWIAYGDDDVFDPAVTNRAVCLGSRFTSGFCAISELSTVISKRII